MSSDLKTVDKDNMAATGGETFATVLTKALDREHNEEPGLSGVKPVFLLESDVFGGGKPSNIIFLVHQEVYKSIANVIHRSHLKGLQRVRGLWRIYTDEEDDRENLLINGLVIRGKKVNLYSRNPRVTAHENPNYIKIRVKDIPCSADDDQISRFLEKSGCTIHNMYRERLRIDSYLTNCQTGDRIFMCDPLPKPLPRSVVIGKYRASIYYRGQPIDMQNMTCRKCFEKGHKSTECPNEMICRQCKKPGHKQSDCTENFEDSNDGSQSESSDEDSDTDGTDDDTMDPMNTMTQMSQSILKPIDNTEVTEKIPEKATVPDEVDDKSVNTQKGKKTRRTKKGHKKGGKKKDKHTSVGDEHEQNTIEKFLLLSKGSVSTPQGKTSKRPATTPTSELHERAGNTKKT